MKLSDLKQKGKAPIMGKGFGKEGVFKKALIVVLAEMKKNGDALTRKEILVRGQKIAPKMSAGNVTTTVVQDGVQCGAVEVKSFNEENYFFVKDGIDIGAKGAINRKYQKKKAVEAPKE